MQVWTEQLNAEVPLNKALDDNMCPECGQIFETKKEVDSHIHMMHEPHLKLSEETSIKNNIFWSLHRQGKTAAFSQQRF